MLTKQKHQEIFAQNSVENVEKWTLSNGIVHCRNNLCVVGKLTSRYKLTQSYVSFDFQLNFDFLVAHGSWLELI